MFVIEKVSLAGSFSLTVDGSKEYDILIGRLDVDLNETYPTTIITAMTIAITSINIQDWADFCFFISTSGSIGNDLRLLLFLIIPYCFVGFWAFADLFLET